jgi:hypothetical protein
MATEDSLLTREWGSIAGPLIRALVLHAGPVLGALLEEPPDALDPAFDAFLAAVLTDLAERRNAAGTGKAHAAEQRWGVAISLMGESAILLKALHEGRERFATGDPMAVFRMIVRRALVTMRWPLLQAKSSDQLKTWDRLDRISRALARERGDELRENFTRCSTEHYELLLAHLRAEHGHDRNLPRTLTSLEGYFNKFCSDCHQGDPGGDDAGDEVTAADINLLPQSDPRLYFLQECVRTLSGVELDVILVWLGDPVDNVHYRTVEMYCKSTRMGRGTFFKHKQAAQLKLGSCIRRKEENMA